MLVVLDSDHSRAHVLAELEAYAPLVSPGSYIVAADGIMADVATIPGGRPEWLSDNPKEAAREFAERNPSFELEEPEPLFHEDSLTSASGVLAFGRAFCACAGWSRGPRFSIVIPTRDRADKLRLTLGTCLDQQFADYEVVVCDNSSSTATREVVDAMRSSTFDTSGRPNLLR